MNFVFFFRLGTGNSPAQGSTRSISPNPTSQFIQSHTSSGTAVNLVGNTSPPQQTVCMIHWNKRKKIILHLDSGRKAARCQNIIK